MTLPRADVAAPAINVHEDQLLIATKFVSKLLGRQTPFESSSEVLQYLVSEADALFEREADTRNLRSQRLAFREALREQAESIHTALLKCGIDYTDDKFASIEAAACFASFQKAPNVYGLISSCESQKEKLEQVKAVHSRLLYLQDALESTKSNIVGCRLVAPDQVLRRMEDDTLQRTLAMRTIANKADQNRRSRSSVRTPSLDISVVMLQKSELTRVTNELTERQAYLVSLQTLPVDLETVQLEIERLSRNLSRLEQQRKDLFRSIRR